MINKEVPGVTKQNNIKIEKPRDVQPYLSPLGQPPYYYQRTGKSLAGAILIILGAMFCLVESTLIYSSGLKKNKISIGNNWFRICYCKWFPGIFGNVLLWYPDFGIGNFRYDIYRNFKG